MARKWSGFLPQNLSIKEEWELLEACTLQARLADERASPAGTETDAGEEEDESPTQPDEDQLVRFVRRPK